MKIRKTIAECCRCLALKLDRPDYGFIATFTNRWVRMPDPVAENLAIEDIAHGLARECRWNGQLKVRDGIYSVAQHSLAVLEFLRRSNEPAEVQFQGLMHDATEAFLKDIPKPFKQLMPDYMRLEEQLWLAICRRFDIDPVLHPSVKNADYAMLLGESEQFRINGFDSRNELAATIVGQMMELGVEDAELTFLEEFSILSEMRTNK